MANPPRAAQRAEGRHDSGGSAGRRRRRSSRGGGLLPVEFLGNAVGSPATLATSFFADTAFSGQVNLLTTGSFDAPQELFSTDMLSRNIAYVRVGAPVGIDGDWTARGAVNQADISSWIVAGSYATQSPAARHQYDIGLSYSTQRYDGGNLLALRDVTDGSRNVGTVYAYDTFTLTPMLRCRIWRRVRALRLSEGPQPDQPARRGDRSRRSIRFRISARRFRAERSRRAPRNSCRPAIPGIWLPPQRTFSSLEPRGSFNAEQTTQADVGVERDFGASTVSLRAFRQHVDDQLVTVFGAEIPGQPAAKVGHYVVGNRRRCRCQRLRRGTCGR